MHDEPTPTRLELEDEAIDIVEKAALGLDRKVPPVSSEADLRAAAAALGLDADRLVAIHRGDYRPEADPPDGVTTLTTRWGRMLVNAYLIRDPGSRKAVLFDTGADDTPVREAMRREGLSLEAIFITHTHPDHVAVLDRFPGVPVHSPAGEPAPVAGAEPVREGDRFRFGSLSVEAVATPGHSPDGTSYVVGGLERPVVVVGDALFAGSMGRPNICHESALASVRQKLFTLPPHAVIFPGHGPPTTVESERLHNPFFPPDEPPANPTADSQSP